MSNKSEKMSLEQFRDALASDATKRADKQEKTIKDLQIMVGEQNEVIDELSKITCFVCRFKAIKIRRKALRRRNGNYY